MGGIGSGEGFGGDQWQKTVAGCIQITAIAKISMGMSGLQAVMNGAAGEKAIRNIRETLSICRGVEAVAPPMPYVPSFSSGCGLAKGSNTIQKTIAVLAEIAGGSVPRREKMEDAMKYLDFLQLNLGNLLP